MLGFAATTLSWLLFGTAAAPATQAQCDISVDRGRVTAASYYGGMEGFAKLARTTGGMGRGMFLVTRPDDDPGPGTLRWAVEQTKRSGGGWIGFAPQMRGQTIRTEAPLRLGSDLTIDGGCSGVKIVGEVPGSLFYIVNQSNVVISRLQLEQTGGGNQGDCVTIGHGSDRVWVANNRIRACRDGLVDVTRNGGAMSRVTISGNLFADHDKSILIDDNSAPGECGGQPRTLVTLYRNRFVDTGQRHPRVAGNALVHVAQNAVSFSPQSREDGSVGASYGVYASNGARVLVEDDYFDARRAGLRNVARDETGAGVCGLASVKVVRSDQSQGAPAASVGNAAVAAMPYRLPNAPVAARGLPAWLDRHTGPSNR